MIAVLTFFLAIITYGRPAGADTCDSKIENCWGSSGRSSSSSPAYPDQSTGFKINPSAVPVENALGGELIYFNQQYDVSLVKGTGRVGAALALTNGELTFFGPPAAESEQSFLQRMQNFKEYQSQKIALAGAVSLFDNRHGGLKHLQLSVGGLVRYNKLSRSIRPGAGFSAIAGPFTLGYAVAGDQTVINDGAYGYSVGGKLESLTETYSLGMYLTSLALDYSLLAVYPDHQNPLRVSLFTASIILKRWVVTASFRDEESDRPAYDFPTKSLYVDENKQDIFGGVQFAVTKNIMVSAFYNYYLMHEGSVGLTLLL